MTGTGHRRMQRQSHGHGHGGATNTLGPPPRSTVVALIAIVGGLAAATLVALALLWRAAPTVSLGTTPGDQPAHLVHARVQTVAPYDCEGTGSTVGPDGRPTKVRCGAVGVVITGGTTTGARTNVLVQPEIYRAGIHPGDDLLVSRFPPTPGGGSDTEYA